MCTEHYAVGMAYVRVRVLRPEHGPRQYAFSCKSCQRTLCIVALLVVDVVLNTVCKGGGTMLPHSNSCVVVPPVLSGQRAHAGWSACNG